MRTQAMRPRLPRLPRLPRPAVLAAAALAAGGCVSRADYAVPEAPSPLRFESPQLPAVPTDVPLTMRDVVTLVHERNPSLARARTAVETALAGLDAAEAALLPRLSAEASYLAADSPSAYLFRRIDSHTLPASVDFNDPGRIQSAEGALALRWNAWDGGRSRLAAWAADADAQAAERAAAAAANVLAAAALAAYLDARAAGDLLAADDASIRTVEAQVAETRTKAEGGGALRSDVLSLEVRLAEARERAIRTGVARRLALTALRSMLALPLDAEVRVSADRFDGGPLPATLSGAVAEAYRTRPDAAAARRAVESARMRLEAAARGDLPRVDLEARTYTDSADPVSQFHDPNWTVALALTFDVFDGGANKAAVRRARAALRDLEEADRRALLEIEGDVEAAWLRLEEARARVEVTAQAVSASEESLALVETQWKGGSVTVTRFLEAESARLSARTADVASRLALERALVGVSRALGRFADGSPKEIAR
jgi:outer membrane protein TolC